MFTRAEHQRTEIHNKVRNELVIYMKIGRHALLHEEVMPPLVPPVDMARELYAAITEEDRSPEQKLGAAMAYFWNTAHDLNHPYHRPAQLLYDNFAEQVQFMD